MVVFLTACGGGKDASLAFRSVATPLCEDGLAAKAQFYVSALTLLDGTPIPLGAKGESSDVGLVELVPCDPRIEFRLPVTLPRGATTGVRFTVGVPENLNHAEPTRAQPPLDRSDMFWTWRLGYKFFALDGDAFAFHLGSTQCVSPAPIRPPSAPCDNPNRITLTLPSFNWDSGVVGVNFGGLLAALKDGARCTGDYSSEACRAAFEELGLDVDSGRCGGDCGQRLFSVVNTDP